MNDDPQGGLLHDLDLRLPPLPHTLSDVLDALEKPDGPDAEAMAEAIQSDPAVVARLLQQINSAYYGIRRSVSSVERAIRMMGASTAAGTVIGMSMLKLKKRADERTQTCFNRLIQHSVGVAFLTRFLLKKLPPEGRRASTKRTGEGASASDGFTEGLLHDLGKMVLVYNFPDEAAALYEERSIQKQLIDSDERALEQLVFGYDHTEAGAYAASKLHFPAGLVNTIRHHHTPASLPGNAAQARCLQAVRAANCTTRAMGDKFVGSRASQTAISWEACARHPVWEHWRPAGAPDDQWKPRLMQTLQAKEEELASHIDRFLDAESAAPRPALS